MKVSSIYRAVFLLALAFLFLLGVGMRRAVLDAQRPADGGVLPFTSESALHFRTIKQVLDEGRVPAVDREVQYPEGVATAETYSISDEYVFAAICRLLPDWGSLIERLRWIAVIWFCLGIPLAALWIAWRTGSRWAGFTTGAFYAVMLGSVMRSTGQELSRENFALPFLLGHMALNALADRQKDRKGAWWAVAGSGILLALALASWDLIRFYIVIFWLLEGWRIIRRNDADSGALYWKTPIQAAAVLAVGLLNPYLRAHAFMLSPAALLGAGIIIVKLWLSWRDSPASAGSSSRPARETWLRLAIILLPLACGLLFSNAFSSHYGHFGELLAAKIRFLNSKPADPGLLSYDARIMWVPALHSATAKTVFSIFPFTLLLTFPLFLVVCYTIYSGRDPEGGFGQITVFYVATFISFLLFVRFHVFLAIFAAGIIGCGTWIAVRKGGWKAWLAAVAVIAAFFGEAANVIGTPEKWGRPAIYYDEKRELLDWIETNIAGEPIVANFGISSEILAYAGNPIVLHPKFENEDIRRKVREYGNTMFKGSESELREWMDAQSARHLVYSMGEFSDLKPEWQMRYFADALDPPKDAPARLFEFGSGKLKWFRLLWGNRKYRIFRVITGGDEERARRLSREAAEALQRGDLHAAEDKAARALLLNPHQTNAIDTLQHAGSLREKGFKSGRLDGQGKL